MLSNASSIKDVVLFLIGIINLAIPVLTVLAVVIFMYSGVRYVTRAEESGGKGPEREALLWGLIALFVLFSIWGILKILTNTFLGTGGGSNEPQATGNPINIIPPNAK
ncbi:MAG TPA: hypothetical protein VHD31_03290 [Candidatus Paceibacterota bacterium]|nr:hypothetical protein [Candidatus Paceibacterota bacterium]